MDQNVYTRFELVIRKFTRRVCVPEGKNHFDADLLFIRDYGKYNDGALV